MGQETVLFRASLGDVLRAERMRQGMTLRELSSTARVSLGYISEIERGQKEASSELLAALCEALDVPLSGVLRDVSDLVLVEELGLEVDRPRSRRGRGRGLSWLASLAVSVSVPRLRTRLFTHEAMCVKRRQPVRSLATSQLGYLTWETCDWCGCPPGPRGRGLS